MKLNSGLLFTIFAVLVTNSFPYKILAIFPYKGPSHHIFFSSFVERLVTSTNDLDVTVVNYLPMKNLSRLHQISLGEPNDAKETVDLTAKYNDKSKNTWFKELTNVYELVLIFKSMANVNCEKLMSNKELQDIINSGQKFDVVISEHFVTDCGLAIGHKLQAVTVGMTAHTLMPWTYSRLGASNHPALVPNHFIATGRKPNFWYRVKSTIINFGFNLYYKYVIQKSDHEIIKKYYPDMIDLETLGRNLSLIMVNQYFPLTGSRAYAPNVVEIGGMHITDDYINRPLGEDLTKFIQESKNGIVYMSFGSLSSNIPRKVISDVIEMMKNSNLRYIWKLENHDQYDIPKNAYARAWLPQGAILHQSNVKAFVTHSGMLGLTEAFHSGVPVVCIPLFADQFSNAAIAVGNGMGVKLDFETIDRAALEWAINEVLQPRYQSAAKKLSYLWKLREPPIDTAVSWIRRLAAGYDASYIQPPSKDIPLYQILMIDVLLFLELIFLVPLYVTYKLLAILAMSLFRKEKKITKLSKKKVIKKE